MGKSAIALIAVVMLLLLLCSCNEGVDESPTVKQESEMSGIGNMYEETLECTLGVPEGHTFYMEYPVQMFFKNEYNLDLTIRYYNPEEEPSALFEGEDAIDLIVDNHHDIRRWSGQGCLQDLETYKDRLTDYFTLWDSKDSAYEMIYTSFVRDGSGKWYGAPSIYDTMYPLNAWFYRKDIFDGLNIDFPEYLENIPETAKDIKNRNGGYPVLEYGGSMIRGIFNSFGTDTDGFHMTVETGEIEYSASDDGWENAIRTYLELLEEDLVYVAEPAEGLREIREDVAIAYIPLYDFPQLSQNNENWTMVRTSPVSMNDTIPLTQRIPDVAPRIMCINAESPPELKARLADFINWTVTQKGILKTWFGDEHDTYERVDGKITLLTDTITWPVPFAFYFVGSTPTKDTARYEMRRLEGRFQMTVPDWDETAYDNREEIIIYKNAAEQCCNSFAFERLVPGEESPLHEEYLKITGLENEFWTGFENSRGNLPVDEIEGFRNAVTALDYRGVIEELKLLYGR